MELACCVATCSFEEISLSLSPNRRQDARACVVGRTRPPLCRLPTDFSPFSESTTECACLCFFVSRSASAVCRLQRAVLRPSTFRASADGLLSFFRIDGRMRVPVFFASRSASAVCRLQRAVCRPSTFRASADGLLSFFRFFYLFIYFFGTLACWLLGLDCENSDVREKKHRHMPATDSSVCRLPHAFTCQQRERECVCVCPD